jgi:hypothetical protein
VNLLENVVVRNGGRYKLVTPSFTDWDQFLNQCEQPQVQLDGSSNEPERAGSNFYGTRDLAHALQLAREGWPEGRQGLMEAKGELDNLMPGGGFKPEFHFAESGDEVDIGRFLGHEPENMIEYEMQPFTGGKGGRIVKLLINVTSGAFIGSKSIYHRGAAALAFTDLLESNGYKVEMWIGEVGILHRNKDTDERAKTGHDLFIRSLIKPAGQSFDLDRLAFALCHPSVQRRLFFRIYEQLPVSVWNISQESHGTVGQFDDPDPEIIEIAGLDNNLAAPEAAAKFVCASLARFGVSLESSV